MLVKGALARKLSMISVVYTNDSVQTDYAKNSNNMSRVLAIKYLTSQHWYFVLFFSLCKHVTGQLETRRMIDKNEV